MTARYSMFPCIMYLIHYKHNVDVWFSVITHDINLPIYFKHFSSCGSFKPSIARQGSFPFHLWRWSLVWYDWWFGTELNVTQWPVLVECVQWLFACRVTSAVTLYGSRSVVNQPFVDMNSTCFVMYPASFKETGLELYPSLKHNGWQMEIEKVDIEKPELPHLNALDGQQPRKPRLGMSKESERQCYNPYMQLATTVWQWTVCMETFTIYTMWKKCFHTLCAKARMWKHIRLCSLCWRLVASSNICGLFLPRDTLNFWRCKV